MRKHVLYSRTAEGHIERMPYAIYKCYHCPDNAINPFDCPDNYISQYVFEETLTGWPETKVFWAKETGLSTGIAVISEPPSD
jgi:hypothetical protein